MRPWTVLVLALALPIVGGCGGTTEPTTNVNTQTLGQQLVDLQKARDSGAISASEYETQRRRLLNQ